MCLDTDTQCMICLQSNYRYTTLKLCGNPLCSCRIHLPCYYNWIKYPSYQGYCVCGEWCDPRRFMLPTPILVRCRPTLFIEPGPNQPDYSSLSCYNYSKRWLDKLVYLTRFYLGWALLCSYLGRVIVYLVQYPPYWNIFTLEGLRSWWYTFILGYFVLFVGYLSIPIHWCNYEGDDGTE